MSWFTINLVPGTLRLGPTLFSGQVFRWRQIDSFIYRGVIGDHVVDLKEETDVPQVSEEAGSKSKDQKEEKKVKSEMQSLTKKEEEKQIKEKDIEEEKTQDILYFKGLTKGGKQSDKNELQQVIRTYFQLDVDYSVLRQAWRKSKVYNQAEKGQTGLRVIKQRPFECFMSFICSQNNNVSRISQLVETIASNYGKLICSIDGSDYFQFPDLNGMSDAKEKQLRGLKFGYRANYIVESCKEFEMKGGEQWLNKLAKLGMEGDEEKVRKALTEFKGVGRKVADCIALFSLNCKGVVPIDTHMLKWAIKVFKLKRDISLTDKVYYEISQKFKEVLGANAGWAHSILFASTLNQSGAEKGKKKKRTTQTLEREEAVRRPKRK